MTADAPKVSIDYVALALEFDDGTQFRRGEIGIGTFDSRLCANTTMISYTSNIVIAMVTERVRANRDR